MPQILFLLQPNGDRFRFTVDSTSQGKLSPKQREFYEENGFLVVPNLVDHKLIDDCRQRFLDIVDGVVDAGAILKMKDLSLKAVQGLPNERVYNKIQDFVWDEVLSQYIQLPEVLDYVQCFTGPNIRAVHTMLINKPPDSGSRTSRHPMHQVGVGTLIKNNFPDAPGPPLLPLQTSGPHRGRLDRDGANRRHKRVPRGQPGHSQRLLVAARLSQRRGGERDVPWGAWQGGLGAGAAAHGEGRHCLLSSPSHPRVWHEFEREVQESHQLSLFNFRLSLH